MRTEITSPFELAIQPVPTSLLHYVFFALHGLTRGQSPLVCAEVLSGGCQNALPLYQRPGRPRKYCSDKLRLARPESPSPSRSIASPSVERPAVAPVQQAPAGAGDRRQAAERRAVLQLSRR
jgi:hypothetical protein